MEKETFINKNGKWVKVSKWDLFWRRIEHQFTKWKIINTDDYWIVPNQDRGHHFVLSDKEHEDAEKLYKEKGTLSYEFFPCGGIGWGVRVKVVDTGEIIDITDVSSW